MRRKLKPIKTRKKKENIIMSAKFSARSNFKLSCPFWSMQSEKNEK